MKTISKIIIIIIVSFIGVLLLGISESFSNRLIQDMNKSNSIKNYEMLETTCNGTNGEPNGECFINAFNECKSAGIKQIGSTVEGDPIFYYANVVLSEPCTIHFAIDTSLDTWGGMGWALFYLGAILIMVSVIAAAKRLFRRMVNDSVLFLTIN